MTSLAHQLKRLALPQNDASLLTRKEIASLLFEPKDAATIDRSTFYALGEFLLYLKPLSAMLRWAQFWMSLFHVRLHRSGGTAGNWDGLPGVPGHLVQLSISDHGAQRPVQRSQPEVGRQHLTIPYPSLPVLPPQASTQVPGVADSPVCTCWVTSYSKTADDVDITYCFSCSFHIHLYNVDSLLACILPYHDTNIFVRVLQLLKIQDATNKWNWLHCLQVCMHAFLFKLEEEEDF